MIRQTAHRLFFGLSLLAAPVFLFGSSVCFVNDCVHLNGRTVKRQTAVTEHCHKAESSSEKAHSGHTPENACCNDLVYDDSGLQNPNGFKLKPELAVHFGVSFDHQAEGIRYGGPASVVLIASAPPGKAPIYLLKRSLLI